jgi:hypothetical protein
MDAVDRMKNILLGVPLALMMGCVYPNASTDYSLREPNRSFTTESGVLVHMEEVTVGSRAYSTKRPALALTVRIDRAPQEYHNAANRVVTIVQTVNSGITFKENDRVLLIYASDGIKVMND